MTKTLTQHLEIIKREGKGIFLPYIMAGDHEKGLAGLAETIAFLENLGVSAIEIGLPFSDPVADEMCIRDRSQRARDGLLRYPQEKRSQLRGSSGTWNGY